MCIRTTFCRSSPEWSLYTSYTVLKYGKDNHGVTVLSMEKTGFQGNQQKLKYRYMEKTESMEKTGYLGDQ